MRLLVVLLLVGLLAPLALAQGNSGKCKPKKQDCTTQTEQTTSQPPAEACASAKNDTQRIYCMVEYIAQIQYENQQTYSPLMSFLGASAPALGVLFVAAVGVGLSKWVAL